MQCPKKFQLAEFQLAEFQLAECRRATCELAIGGPRSAWQVSASCGVAAGDWAFSIVLLPSRSLGATEFEPLCWGRSSCGPDGNCVWEIPAVPH